MLEVARARAARRRPEARPGRGAAVQGRLVRAGDDVRSSSTSSTGRAPSPSWRACSRRAAGFAVATFDPAHFERVLAERALPVDRRRSTGSASRRGRRSRAELLAAGFAAVAATRRRSAADDRPRGGARADPRPHISTFDLSRDEEFAAGLARAERELPERVEYRIEWLSAERPSGRPCSVLASTSTPLTRSREAGKESKVSCARTRPARTPRRDDCPRRRGDLEGDHADRARDHRAQPRPRQGRARRHPHARRPARAAAAPPDRGAAAATRSPSARSTSPSTATTSTCAAARRRSIRSRSSARPRSTSRSRA